MFLYFFRSGRMYECPEGFIYWDVSKRCERQHKVPKCQRESEIDMEKPSIAPLETNAVGY